MAVPSPGTEVSWHLYSRGPSSKICQENLKTLSLLTAKAQNLSKEALRFFKNLMISNKLGGMAPCPLAMMPLSWQNVHI